MISWDYFIYFAIVSVLFWIIGSWRAFKGKHVQACALTTAGLVVFGTFIGLLWLSLERPPLRTIGETRLWYCFFLPLAGLITYVRWRYKWILGFSSILSVVFICVNILKPEIHNKALMPALQSPWFAPHVIIYMFAYAMLGAAAIMGSISFMGKEETDWEKGNGDVRQSGLCRTGIHDAGNAYRSFMG